MPPADLPHETPPPASHGEPSWSRVAERLQQATAGEYEIVRELGRGGMAAVFLARETATNRFVALKVMSPTLLEGADMVPRFRKEAVTMARMSHPNIVTIFAVRHVAELHVLVMRYVEGATLDRLSRAVGLLPIAPIRAILRDVGSALAYAHRHGVVHRDVKPSNILIDGDGRAVVTDFGIAKVAGTTTYTKTGAVIGTPSYISPEQCSSGAATGQSDQYALGVVAFQLLTDRVPFSGAPFDVMRAHVHTRPPAIRPLRSDCPPEMEAAVHRMLAKRPGDRWPTMAQALDALGAGQVADDADERQWLAERVRG